MSTPGNTAADVRGEVLVLSLRGAGGVRFLVPRLRARGHSPVLVSEDENDVNAASCDRHVLVDWTAAPAEVTAAVRREVPQPVAVVSMVEALLPWQIDLAVSFGLAGASDGLSTLTSKAEVRAAMLRLGLSDLKFAVGTPGDLTAERVPFPAVCKPSRGGGASRGVRVVRTADELTDHLGALRATDGEDVEVVAEAYVSGREFAMDGPVEDYEYRPLVVFEKDPPDDDRLHDTGVLVSPPPSAEVADGARELATRVSALCRDLGILTGWLHVEGRARVGHVELIEINPRLGGGVTVHALKHLTGVDPVDTILDAALPGPPPPRDPVAARSVLLGAVAIEPEDAGVVTVLADVAEVMAMPGVVGGHVLSPYRATAADQENFFADILLTAADLDELRSRSEAVREAVTFVVAPVADD